MKDWIHDSIFGEPPVASPSVPNLPIVDDEPPLTTTMQRSDSLNRLLELAERAAAIKAIFGEAGQEMWELVKNSAEPSTPTYDSGSGFPKLPAPTSDPRKPECDCSCQSCRTQDCRNCNAPVCCEFSALVGPLSDILPVDGEEESKLRAAARARQQDRIGTSRIAKHKRALAPMVANFRDSLQPHSGRVPDELWENLANAMAADVAAGLATL